MDWSRRTALLIAVALTVLSSQTGQTQSEPTDALKFFKNFFVTGDYIAAGVGLEGKGNSTTRLAKGFIDLGSQGQPDGAEVLAAFLYWQVISADGSDGGVLTATFNGRPLSSPDLTEQGITTPHGSIAVLGDPFGTSPCWSSGGGTGESGGSKRTFSYRADVLRFLDVVNGRHRITGSYAVELPDLGNSNATPRALGASLVIIYRNPNQAPSQALNAIVIYDGSHTVDNAHPLMSQSVKGFYDPSNVNGKITHISGAGQLNKTDLLVAPGISETNAFRSSDGASWDTITRTTTPLLNGATSFTTTVGSGGSSSADCLTWGAVIYRTEVKDTDKDGLLDKWENSTIASLLKDPNGEYLPALGDMGADPLQKDLFVEIGYMTTGNTAYTYGGVSKPAHNHRPTYEALEKVGLAFASRGIDVHFDVGNNYQGQPYIISTTAGANGGESLNEAATQCTPANSSDTPWTLEQPWKCQFDNHPGTMGWKVGLRFVRDEPLSPNTYEQCEANETDGDTSTTCTRRFDSNRRDMFHYAWFAHALAIPQISCLITYSADADDTPDPYDTKIVGDPSIGFPSVPCQQSQAAFHVPVTNTGIGDFVGGDVMVTLGGFNNGAGLPVGSDHMQAATLMHELGHNLGLLHGALATTRTQTTLSIAPEPNCKPNYLSIMNYLFQLRGLKDANGITQVDFAGSQQAAQLNETTLSDPAGLGAAVLYRTSWFAPAANVPFSTSAARHCDGSPLKVVYTNHVPSFPEPTMARVDSPSVTDTISNIDWNQAATQPGSQDINFDGIVSSTLNHFDDWASLRLNQVASRRNVGAWYWVNVGLAQTDSGWAAYMGPLSLNVDHGDVGPGDLGQGYLGQGYLGQGYLGQGYLGDGDTGPNLGQGYLGQGYLGQGYLGQGYLGQGYLGQGYLGQGYLGQGYLGDRSPFELDITAVVAGGLAPPQDLKAIPLTGNDVRLEWTQSTLTSEFEYRLYRYAKGANPNTAVELPGSPVTHVANPVTYTSVQTVPKGTYIYVVAAQFTNPATGQASEKIELSRK